MVSKKSVVAGLAALAIAAITAGYLAGADRGFPGVTSGALAQTASPQRQWAASATGRIEPKEGAVRLPALASGEIEQVLVKNNDRVAAGDLLVRLEDDDALERITGADAEVQVRRRERDDDAATGLALDRRRAEDVLADAERSLFGARLALDEAQAAVQSGKGKVEDISAARERRNTARKEMERERSALLKVLAKDNMPLPTRLEAALTQARSELSLAEEAVERTRVRAPFAGTVLDVHAKAGELASPSAELPMITMGDLASLRVRAEVEERDVTKVRVGQGVVIRADAFPDRDFEGKVTSVAPSLGSPRIASRGPRRPNDVEVLEVMAALDGTPPLLPGMRVDVFFKVEEGASAATKAN